MPIYQYDCATCEHPVEVFFRSAKAATDPACPDCGGRDLKRRISRVARVRSSSQRLSDIDVNQELGRLDSQDPADFSRWARRMGDQFDDELGSDFGELADRADAGDDPIERADPGHALSRRLSQAKDQVSGDGGDV